VHCVTACLRSLVHFYIAARALKSTRLLRNTVFNVFRVAKCIFLLAQKEKIVITLS